MQTTIDIAIADDHLIFIEGLKMLLGAEQDICIAGVAHNGQELLHLVQQRQPHLVLLDINMPLLNGLDALKLLKQSQSNVKLIMLSTYNEDHLIERAKANGASGYLLKNCSRTELLHTIRLVTAGHTCFPYRQPPAIGDFGAADGFSKQFNLTKRELEVIRLIGKGNTSQEISETLHLSVYTVETHRRNIMQKLGVSNAAALMKFIYDQNL